MKELKILMATLFCIGCGNLKTNPLIVKEQQEEHQATVKYVDGTQIYIDKVPNEVVMKNEVDSNAKTIFSSFRLGYIDSMTRDKKADIEIQKYFEYEMGKNWVAMIKGDSVRSVFFQTIPRKTTLLREAVIVFEIPKSATIDTLVYRDKFRPSEINVIVFNRK